LSIKEKDMEKAEAILQQLEGMRIKDAQNLLDWCSEYLLNQPVGKWSAKASVDNGKE